MWSPFFPHSILRLFMLVRIHDVKHWDQFKVIDFEPKKIEDYDIDIKIEFCGVCGSDVRVHLFRFSLL